MPTRRASTSRTTQPVTDEQIREIERRVNAEILANQETQARVMDIEAAQKTGAVMLFGEKYGDTVRVLDIGSSRELCGGTHVQRTGDIGLFKVVSEGGVAAGIRRIEAVTGANALAYLQQLEATVNRVAGTLKASPTELQGRVDAGAGPGARARERSGPAQGQARFVARRRTASRRPSTSTASRCWRRGWTAPTPRRCATPWTSSRTSSRPPPSCWRRSTAARCRSRPASRPTRMGKVKAGELVNFVAQQVGGKGGGKPDMAMAGGTDAEQAHRRAAVGAGLGGRARLMR